MCLGMAAFNKGKQGGPGKWCGWEDRESLCLHLLLVFGDENKGCVLFSDFSHRSRIVLILQVMMTWCRTSKGQAGLCFCL